MGPDQLAKFTIDDIIRSEGMVRWHMVRIKRPQSLAEHTFKVLMLSIKIASKLGTPLSPVEWLELYSWAIAHDLDEIDLGDIPTPVKMQMNVEWTTLAAEFWRSRGIEIPLVSGRAITVVKAADLFEAWQYYKDYGYDDCDSKGESILKGCADRFLNYVGLCTVNGRDLNVGNLIDLVTENPY